MSLPSIAVINFTSTLHDQAVQDAIRVVNRQVTEDFIPLWGYGRQLQLHAVDFHPADPDTLTPQKVYKTAEFMNKIGTIKHHPSTWKDLFFPEVQGVPGD